jgi:hypothetical protein
MGLADVTVVQYTKRPDTVQVIKYDGTNVAEVNAWVAFPLTPADNGTFMVHTVDGASVVNVGDWVVKAADGTFRVMDPVSFDAAYYTTV